MDSHRKRRRPIHHHRVSTDSSAKRGIFQDDTSSVIVLREQTRTRLSDIKGSPTRGTASSSFVKPRISSNSDAGTELQRTLPPSRQSLFHRSRSVEWSGVDVASETASSGGSESEEEGKEEREPEGSEEEEEDDDDDDVGGMKGDKEDEDGIANERLSEEPAPSLSHHILQRRCSDCVRESKDSPRSSSSRGNTSAEFDIGSIDLSDEGMEVVHFEEEEEDASTLDHETAIVRAELFHPDGDAKQICEDFVSKIDFVSESIALIASHGGSFLVYDVIRGLRICEWKFSSGVTDFIVVGKHQILVFFSGEVVVLREFCTVVFASRVEGTIVSVCASDEHQGVDIDRTKIFIATSGGKVYYGHVRSLIPSLERGMRCVDVHDVTAEGERVASLSSTATCFTMTRYEMVICDNVPSLQVEARFVYDRDASTRTGAKRPVPLCSLSVRNGGHSVVLSCIHCTEEGGCVFVSDKDGRLIEFRCKKLLKYNKKGQRCVVSFPKKFRYSDGRVIIKTRAGIHFFHVIEEGALTPRERDESDTSPVPSFIVHSGDNKVRLYSREGLLLRVLFVPQTFYRIRSCRFQRRFLISGGEDGRIYVFDIMKTKRIFRSSGSGDMHEYPVSCIALSPNDGIMMTADSMGMLRVWKSLPSR
eukprot:TRINITY_DN587_c0_g1_i1.p1 TRINITY_DN587_c0_g1~~TRINITY_DN587_c0_g1_i1.p1  ORF type:complete len:646 (+),score=189.25 TRINITY_DN587_c0_g1_i1:123-2060(+)